MALSLVYFSFCNRNVNGFLTDFWISSDRILKPSGFYGHSTARILEWNQLWLLKNLKLIRE